MLHTRAFESASRCLFFTNERLEKPSVQLPSTDHGVHFIIRLQQRLSAGCSIDNSYPCFSECQCSIFDIVPWVLKCTVKLKVSKLSMVIPLIRVSNAHLRIESSTLESRPKAANPDSSILMGDSACDVYFHSNEPSPSNALCNKHH